MVQKRCYNQVIVILLPLAAAELCLVMIKIPKKTPQNLFRSAGQLRGGVCTGGRGGGMEAERALLSCLMQTVSSIAPHLWTEADRQCVRGHLEEVLTSSSGGCLSAESRRAARQVFAALVEAAVDTDTLLVPQSLFDTGDSNGVTVRALKPTTTVAKCISYSILCCQGIAVLPNTAQGSENCVASPPSGQTPPSTPPATPESLLSPPFTLSPAIPRLTLPTPPHVPRLTLPTPPHVQLQIIENAVPKIKKPCRYSRAELLSMCVPGALIPDLPTEDWTVAIIKGSGPASPQEEELPATGPQCNGGGGSIVIRMPRGPSEHSSGWGRPRTWSGGWRQAADPQQLCWREEEGGARNHQRTTPLRRRNSWSNSRRRRSVRRDSWREEEEGEGVEEGAGQGARQKYSRSISDRAAEY